MIIKRRKSIMFLSINTPTTALTNYCVQNMLEGLGRHEKKKEKYTKEEKKKVTRKENE